MEKVCLSETKQLFLNIEMGLKLNFSKKKVKLHSLINALNNKKVFHIKDCKNSQLNIF